MKKNNKICMNEKKKQKKKEKKKIKNNSEFGQYFLALIERGAF